MESYPVLFPPVKSQTHPTTAAMPDQNIPAAAPPKRLKPPQMPVFVPPGHVVFRFLCHASRVGGVIGKSGSVVKNLQQLTNSKIRVEDPLDPCDEHRVICVFSSPAITNRVKLPVLAPKDGEQENGNDGDGWFDVSAAQEGVLRVFEKVVEVTAIGEPATGLVSVRLLLSKNQGGAVIGKGGVVVEKLKKETGCRIQVFNSDKFSSDIDGIVEIEGNISSLKKALVLVTRRLQEFRPPIPLSSINHPSSYGPKPLELLKVPNMKSRTQEVVFKILCPSVTIGGIIGKAGCIVEAIKSKTGATVCIGPPVAECDDRLITITSMESVESEYSPAQNATILVFNRSIEAANFEDSSGSSSVSARVVVPINQVGCLLGKGGAIISEMRRATRTGQWLIKGNQIPKCCASENGEVLQITGELANVRDAMFKVTSKLRDNVFSMNGRVNGNFVRTDDDNSDYDNNVFGRAKNSTPDVSQLSLGISDSFNEHKSLTESMDHHQISKRSATIVTNTTLELAVLNSAIGSIYGENGSNLLRLRQISGAKVLVKEPRPGTNLRSVVISGTPEETQVAQSLIQAFIQAGS